MNNRNIYFSDDSELAEYEAANKGYRIDVYVKIDKDIYNLRIYTLNRLQTQRFYEKLKPMDQYIDITQLVKVQ